MEKDNRNKLLKKVTTRKLLASIKQDIRREMRPASRGRKLKVK